jgi:hypothetical protein
MDTIYIIEERELAFCSCKVSQLMEKGHIYKHVELDENSLPVETLWYNEASERPEVLEDFFERGFLKRLDNKTNLAVKLGLASEHWKVLSVSDSPWHEAPGQRCREMIIWRGR